MTAIRRAEKGDAGKVSQLLWDRGQTFEFENESALSLHLCNNIIPKAILSMVVVGDEVVMGFGSFDEIQCKILEMEGVNVAIPSNSIFMTCLEAETETVSELIVRTLFATLPGTDFILHEGNEPIKHFEIIEQESKSEKFMMTCARIKYQPNLKVREAKVEDYDDLVDLFDTQSQVLSETYGKYFLADLIESQDNSSRAVVAESGDQAVGLLCLSSEVDISVLASAFDLEPFNFLTQSGSLYSESKCNDSSVFAVTLFCIDEAHRERSRDMIEEAFNQFPDKDFCALTIPTNVYEGALLPYFFSVPMKEGAGFSHSLYLMHRDSLRGITVTGSIPGRWTKGHEFEVCPLTTYHDIAGLIQDESVLRDIEEFESTAITVAGQLVGVVVLDMNPRLNLLSSLFDGVIDSAMQHARIRHLIINPIFSQFTRSVLRMVMNLSNVQVMHYQLYSDMVPNWKIVEEFVQIKPRRMSHVQRKHRARNLHVPRDTDTRFGLFTLTKSALSSPRIIVNTRLVIVGSSDCGLATVEGLLVNPHTCFSSITLVSPGGLPDERIRGTRELCTQGTAVMYDSVLTDRIAFSKRVQIVDERMVYVERDAKAIVLSDGSLLEYDYLVLATGLQDTSLYSNCGLQAGDIEKHKGLLKCVFSVQSNPVKANQFRQIVETYHEESTCVVYGSTVEAFSAIEVLLSCGIPGERIILVHTNKDTFSCFCDDQWIKSRMQQVLEENSIQIITEKQLVSIEQGNDKIRAIHLRTFSVSEKRNSKESEYLKASSIQVDDDNGLENERIECGLLITAADRNIDPDVFAAINESGLVYDGRLVVDSQFRTSDPSIFGAGTNTKFSRSLRSKLPLEHFSSIELGTKVAHCIERVVDPVYREPSKSIPSFEQAKVNFAHAELPGGLRYFRATTPGWVPESKSSCLETNGEESFCKLDIDRYGRISAISYAVSDTYFPKHNMKNRIPPMGNLIGIHLSYLNDIEFQLENDHIDDILEFLGRDWATVLYHDAFPAFVKTIQNSENSNQQVLEALQEAYRSELTDVMEIRTKRNEMVGTCGNQLPAHLKKNIRSQLMEFISQHKDILDMYYLE